MARSRREGRVVIMDANTASRQLLADVLEREGYDVRHYDAMSRLGEQPDFAIVNLDVVHGPVDSGIDVARRLRLNWPAAHVIVVGTAVPRVSLSKEFEHIWLLAPGNFVDAVLAKLEQVGSAPPRRPCFVIMPFSTGDGSDKDRWTSLFSKVIKPAVEKSGRYRCTRADPPAGDVLGQLISDLLGAEVVIADLTAGKPNVFYELGLRHAEGGITVLISQNDLPFDVVADAYITYSLTDEGLEQLGLALEANIVELGNEIERGRQANYVPRVSTYVQTYRKKLTASNAL